MTLAATRAVICVATVASVAIAFVLVDPALAQVDKTSWPVCQRTCADGWRGLLCYLDQALAACRS